MKVVVTVASLAPRFGGPSRSVPALCNALARQGAAVELIALREKNEPPATGTAFVQTLVDTSSSRYRPLDWAKSFQTAILKSAASGGDVILHDNGVWLPNNYFAAKCARQGRFPLIITPRGMLSSWALNAGRWKKRMAWSLYQKRCLTTAQVLHATSNSEADEFRALGLTGPIAMIPNGTDFPICLKPGTKGSIRSLLFIGRIHPVKGLSFLVEAWSRLKPVGWEVVIAGGDENGHRAQIEAQIRSCGLEQQFRFVGQIEGNEKWEFYRKADLFVLPSQSENFGLVIAEALASGVPVITTRGTPWEDLQTHRCGWWTDIGTDPLLRALREAMAISDQERLEMGARGRSLVERKYSWSNVASQMKTVYEWMLEKGPKPNCIV